MLQVVICGRVEVGQLGEISWLLAGGGRGINKAALAEKPSREAVLLFGGIGCKKLWLNLL